MCRQAVLTCLIAFGVSCNFVELLRDIKHRDIKHLDTTLTKCSCDLFFQSNDYITNISLKLQCGFVGVVVYPCIFLNYHVLGSNLDINVFCSINLLKRL